MKNLPPLSLHVRHVLGMRAQKQMIDVAAMAHVTVMEDVQPLRDWPILGNPRQTVNALHRVAIPEFAVALWIQPALEKKAPVCVGLAHGCEAIRDRFAHGEVIYGCVPAL